MWPDCIVSDSVARFSPSMTRGRMSCHQVGQLRPEEPLRYGGPASRPRARCDAVAARRHGRGVAIPPPVLSRPRHVPPVFRQQAARPDEVPGPPAGCGTAARETAGRQAGAEPAEQE